MTTWLPGTPLALRGIVHNKVWIAHAVRVIEDTDELLAVYLQPGAACKIPSGLIGRKYSGEMNAGSRWDEQDGPGWQLMDWEWQHRSAIILMQPDKYYDVNWFRSADTGLFEGWYVNFQLPFRKTVRTIDTLDLEIDLIVEPDKTSRWKDESEYQEGVRRGSIPAEQARAVEKARLEVVGLIAGGSPLFDDPRWHDWQPQRGWTPPQLPDDWSVVEQ